MCNGLNKITIIAGLSGLATIGIGDQIMLMVGLVAAECVSTASACATYSTGSIASLLMYLLIPFHQQTFSLLRLSSLYARIPVTMYATASSA